MTRKIMLIMLLLALVAISDARLPQKGDHVVIVTSSSILQGNINEITDSMIGLNCSYQKIGDKLTPMNRDVVVGIGQIALLMWTTGSEEELIADFADDD
jgi:hypothetical protein